MPINFKMTKEDLLELISDQIKNSSDSDVAEITQMLINRNEGSRYIICPTNVNVCNKVDVKSILYVSQPPKKNAKIYLLTGEEIPFNITDADLLSYIETHFEDEFKCLDQVNGILVNMKMVKWYDSYLNRVYFSDDDFIQVTGAAVRKILPVVKGKEFDLDLMKKEKEKGVYSPLSPRFGKKLT